MTSRKRIIIYLCWLGQGGSNNIYKLNPPSVPLRINPIIGNLLGYRSILRISGELLIVRNKDPSQLTNPGVYHMAWTTIEECAQCNRLQPDIWQSLSAQHQWNTGKQRQQNSPFCSDIKKKINKKQQQKNHTYWSKDNRTLSLLIIFT